jgi:hypothetical protein
MSTAPAETAAPSDTDATKSNQSEDTLIFGSAPSRLFDEIAIRIDNLLTEEISTLPLLPRKKNDDSKKSGEEILLGDLRKAYSKNLDILENYCARNVFSIRSFNKTKRRKVLDQFLNGGEDEGDKDVGEASAAASSVPQSKFDPPAKNEEMPTAQQIMAMDEEILLARHRLHTEKQRRAKLLRQIESLKGVMRSLSLLQDALKGQDGKDFDDLQEKIEKAREGHQEIKAWNGKAEEVIQMLDRIKHERDGGAANREEMKLSAISRDADEKDRRRVWEEMNGGEAGREVVGSQGTGEEIASLLKKLREK